VVAGEWGWALEPGGSVFFQLDVGLD